MRLFLDSSALAKRYVVEPGTDIVLERCREADEVLLSVLAPAEVASALNRLRREMKLILGQYRRLKAEVLLDCAEATTLEITPDVVHLAIRCLELEPLRALDALHVATAQHFGCDLFLSADQPQVVAARRFGLRAEMV